jgi:hypothetical protein
MLMRALTVIIHDQNIMSVSLLPNVMIECLALQLRIIEVSGSNLGS